MRDRTLHVAMIVRTFSTRGGLELYTHKLVEGFLAAGIRVTVFCAENNSQLDHKKLEVRKFLSSSAPLKAKRLIEEFNSLNEVLREAPSFDICHSQHQPVLGANVVTFHNHTVRCLTQRGLGWERALNRIKMQLIPAYRLRYLFDRLLFENAQCSVYTSAATRDDFVATYSSKSPPRALQVVAYPGADLDSTDLSLTDLGSTCNDSQHNSMPTNAGSRADSHPPVLLDQHVGRDRTFLFVGRGYRKKGLDVLFAACAQLKNRSIPFKLLIAGLPNKVIYKLQLRLLGIENEVEFLGFHNNMSDVYSRCAYLVMPSRVEPFGMAVVQAMHYGIVPIVSRVSGVGEILSHGQDSLLLQDHLSAGELAALMSRLLQDRELVSRLSQQSVKTANQLTWEKTLEATLNAYQLVLQTKVSSLNG